MTTDATPSAESLAPAKRRARLLDLFCCAGGAAKGSVMSVAGHVAPIAKAREVMEINWTTREELAEAIPPYYAEYVGRQLMAHIEAQEVAA